MKKIIQLKIFVSHKCAFAILFCMSVLMFQSAYSATADFNSPLQQVINTKKITIKLDKKSLKEILYAIQVQSGIDFIIKEATNIDRYPSLSIDVKDKSIAEALDILLAKTDYTYTISNNIIVIKDKPQVEKTKAVEERVKINGVVFDYDGKTPLPGATILVNGTTDGAIADGEGKFLLTVKKGDLLDVSFIGMMPKVVKVDNKTDYMIILEKDNLKISDVVVNGIFTRKTESYAGSSNTISAKELKRAGNQNIIQSLKNLDPSFYVLDNLAAGSNPNSLPEMQMRGTSSLPNNMGTQLKGNYQNKPNQPLFILDGFETSVEKVFDLDMNRVESVTILKDASAKALYGSKAANGVVVIETFRLVGNETRVSYVGSIDITAPDLTSYNLCNSREKLQAELLEGVYYSENADTQIELWEKYNEKDRLVREGLDTYWLSKPLQTGVGHKHNLSIEVGDSRSLRGVIDFSYNNSDGVMKGSGRTNISGNTNMSYRVSNFLFRNIMSINNNTSKNSPYGLFSTYTKMNPYWRATDENGKYVRWADKYTPNPLFDSTIGTTDKESYLNFTNNFYAEWSINNEFKMTGRLGFDLKRSDSDVFLPASHSSFVSFNDLDNEAKLRRGSYTYESGKGETISADINLNYDKSVGKHYFFANIGFKISNESSVAKLSKAEGFPSNMGADLTFARQYAMDSRPSSYSTLVRELNVPIAFSYAFDDRYLAGLTCQMSASSLYGKDNRWAPSWAAEAGWNIHNEKFLKDSDVIKRLKIRSSIGVTGNQNFNTNETITTYQYYTDENYQGLVGSYMSGLANPDLKLEQRRDFNVGFDAEIGKFTARFDYYNAVTENMVADVSIVNSTGFSTVKDNLGRVRNRGFELTLGYTVLQNKNGYLNISAWGVSEKNYIISLSDAMKRYNEQQEASAAEVGQSKPVLMYRDGQAMGTIWAVPSMGIDPTTGNEVYVKQDGSLTNLYSPFDLVAAGVDKPKYRGQVSVSGEYKGFGLSVICKFDGGGEMYNQTLVDKVENIDIYKQVDRRVLLGRWQYPGQNAQFKRLVGINSNSSDVVKTQATSRFVQKNNNFDIASVTAYYEFGRKILGNTPIERLRLSFYMNDVCKFSSVEIERGLNYPFARSFSFSLTATF